MEWLLVETRREKEEEVEGAAVDGQGATDCRLRLRPRMRNIVLSGGRGRTAQTAATQQTDTPHWPTIAELDSRWRQRRVPSVEQQR